MPRILAKVEPKVPELETVPDELNNHSPRPGGSGRRLQTRFWKAGIAAISSAVLSACGGGSSSSSSSTGTVPSPSAGASPAPAPGAITDAAAARFLLQAQFSVNSPDISAVQSQGYAAWLSSQMAVPVSQTGRAWLDSQGYNSVATSSMLYNPLPGDYMIWRMLLTGQGQFRQRISLALSEIMVVSYTKLIGQWRPYLLAGYWDMLNTHVFGNYRTLLEAVALNPCVGTFLNVRGSQKANTLTGRRPDENFAREVMQLFTIGLYELNIDGSPKINSFGNKIETYGLSDVTNLAKVFTGLDIDGSAQTVPWQSAKISTTDFASKPMVMKAANHSFEAASFLGTSIPENTDGYVALAAALDTLFNHPNTAPFFAKQMIQKLVTSNPSQSYVARVASVFNNNGAGIRGDLKAVWTAILTDEEALSFSGAATQGKLREPMVRFIQWARTFNVTSSTGKWEIGSIGAGPYYFGQSPLRAPSVFNFYRPEFTPPNTSIAANNKVAPEFQIHDEISTSRYVNAMQKIIPAGINDAKPNYAEFILIAHQSTQLLDRLNLLLTANQLSPTTLAIIKQALDAKAVTEASPNADKLNRVYAAILLIMACPEYLIQK